MLSGPNTVFHSPRVGVSIMPKHVFHLNDPEGHILDYKASNLMFLSGLQKEKITPIPKLTYGGCKLHS